MSLSLLLVPQGKEASILSSIFSRLLCPTLLEGQQMSPVLKSARGNQALDLGSLGNGLSVLLNGTTNNILANIVLLLKLEELANLGGTLGSETQRINGVGQSREGRISLLDNNDVQDGQVICDNAATNGSSSAMSRSLGTEAVGVFVKQQSNTLVLHNTLLHREALLVVTTGDLEDVTLVLLTKGIARNLRSNTLVIVEDSQLLLVFKLDCLLRSRGGIGDVELHGERRCC